MKVKSGFAPKRVKSSLTLNLRVTPVTARVMNDVIFKFEKRAEEGREYVLLEAANIILKELRSINPEVDGSEYVSDLKVAILSGASDEDAVAIYYDKAMQLSDEDINTALLFISPQRGAKPWVSVLQKYQPWPARIMPTRLSPSQAKVLSRKTSEVGMQKASRRIEAKRRAIEVELERAGLRGAKIGSGRSVSGMQVVEDVAYSILRAEFGVGVKSSPHWRRSLRKLKTEIKGLGKKYLHFIETGGTSHFNIPKHDMRSASITNGRSEAETLAKAVPMRGLG